MTDETQEKKKALRKPLSLSLTGIPKTTSSEQIRQSLSHGRSKTVTLEVKRKRISRLDRSVENAEGGSKLTDQEQSLRAQAVRDAENSPRAKAEEAFRHIIEDVIEVPLVEAPIEEEHTPIVIAPSVEVKKVLPVAPPSRKRRGAWVDKEVEEAPRKTAFKASKRQGAVKTGRDTGRHEQEEQRGPFRGLKKLGKGRVAQNTSRSTREFSLEKGLLVSELAGLVAKKGSLLLRHLNKMGIEATMDTMLDVDIAQMLAEELGANVNRVVSLNREDELWNASSDPEHLKSRPPVVTIMGHVDHGKTSLLDALRKTDVAGKEAGSITQHIGAYQVLLPSGKTITFIDTPGHEAFTRMRARGANLTDIIVLVVAADEGVSAQTIEAIRHGQAAKVPMIVAINKIDKPGADPDRVRRELLTHHLVVEKLGGDIQDVEVSALKGTNLLGLEEAILLQAEILSLQADPTLRAKGIVLETHVKKGHGNVATVLIQDGTLVKGDIFVAGMVLGRVRLLFDDKGKVLSKASLAQPVEVVGWTELPQPGDRLMVMPSDHAAKEFLDWKKELEASNKSEPLSIKTTLEQHLKDQHIKEFLLILKSDAQGSLEGILHELAKIQHEEVSLKVIHSAVGSINEGDVLLAQSMGAMLVGFNVSVLPEARKLIEQNESLHFFNHKVIYHVIEDVKKAMSGLLAVTYEEEFLGRAKVIQLFPVKKGPTVVGCGVREGLLRRGEHVRIVRGKETVYEGIIKNLRHVKEDVKEMAAGYECGAIFAGAYDIKLDDVVTCFSKKEIRRSV